MKLAALIVDDHDVVRRGLQALLRETFPDAEFGTAKGRAEMAAQIEERTWDLVILEPALDNASGLQLIEAIHQKSPGTKVLVFTRFPEEWLGVRAIREGADGFVSKSQNVEDLFEAIRRIQAGHRFLSPSLAEKLADAVLRPPEEGLPSLSNREAHVVMRIGQGRTTSEIAGEMNLSVKTISTYRSRALEKLHLQSTADLVRFALENKLTT